MDEYDDGIESHLEKLTRRSLLARGAQVGGGASLAAVVLAACGSGSGSSATSGSGTATVASLASARSGSAATDWKQGALAQLPGGTPRMGGRLTMGVISAGTAETIFPGQINFNGDFARAYNLFNFLFYAGRDLGPLTPGLAISAEPNRAATVWTLKLRPGVEWHDGSDFSADDVVWNFTNMWSQTTSFAYGASNGLIDFKGVKKIDDLTVQIPLLTPMAAFPSLLAFQSFGVTKNGMTQKEIEANPIGTGPFKYKTFTPGQYSLFERNPNYWESGKPYVDEFVVNSSFTNENAMFNALLAGDINLAAGPTLTSARQQVTAKQIQVLAGPPVSQLYTFEMRVDKPPYSDNNVRQALKYLVDREAMIEGALAGWGIPGNDVIGIGAEYYDDSITATHDPERAKALFAKAGVKSLTLQTSQTLGGQIEAATLLTEQAQAIGIDVKLQELAAQSYFTTASGYLTRPFGQDVMVPSISLAMQWRTLFAKGAPYNETYWGSQPGGAAALKLINQAIGELNPDRATELWRECQLQQAQQGGYVLWASFPFVDVAGPKVRGLKAGAGYNFNLWRMQDGWLAA